MLEMEGSDGDWGSCCLFARSGETGKRGVPGEAGKLKTGSMGMDFADLDPCVLDRDASRRVTEQNHSQGDCASCVAGQRPLHANALRLIRQ